MSDWKSRAILVKPSESDSSWKSKSEKLENKKGMFESLLANLGQGASFDFADEASGIVEGAIPRAFNYITGDSKNFKDKSIIDAITSGYKTERDATREYLKQTRQDQPAASMAGTIASAVPQMFAPGGAALKIGGAIGQGALSGVGAGTGDISSQLASTGLGAGMGAAGQGVANLIGGIPKALSNAKVGLALKELGAERGSVNKLDLGGDWGKQVADLALENKLVTPFSSTADKLSDLGSLRFSIGQDIGKFRENIPNPTEFAPVGAPDFKKMGQQMPGIGFDKIETALKEAISINPNFKNLNAVEKSQLDEVLGDMWTSSKINGGQVPITEYSQALKKLWEKSRPTGAPLNESQKIYDNMRKSLAQLERTEINNPNFNALGADYAKTGVIDRLLSAKRQKEAGNSILGVGGLIGGGAGISALASGNPEYAALGLLGVPAVRSKIGQSLATSMHAAGKPITQITQQMLDKIPLLKNAVESGKLSPQQAMLMLNRLILSNKE